MGTLNQEIAKQESLLLDLQQNKNGLEERRAKVSTHIKNSYLTLINSRIVIELSDDIDSLDFLAKQIKDTEISLIMAQQELFGIFKDIYKVEDNISIEEDKLIDLEENE